MYEPGSPLLSAVLPTHVYIMSKADVIYGMLVYGYSYGMASMVMVVFDLMLFYLHLDLVYKALTLPLYICPTPAYVSC